MTSQLSVFETSELKGSAKTGAVNYFLKFFEVISDDLFQIARTQTSWNTCWMGASEFLKWLLIPK